MLVRYVFVVYTVNVHLQGTD